MSEQRADILLHPVRMRIVLSMGNDQLTTAQLADRVPEIPPATLYRHVSLLIDAGMIDVVDEKQIRGGVERTLQSNSAAMQLDAEDVSHMTLEQHRAAFTSFAGALVASFNQYLDSPEADPVADSVTYRQVALNVTDTELEQMAADVLSALEPYLDLPEGSGRKRRTLSTILLPQSTP